jgi:hypothetical protein
VIVDVPDDAVLVDPDYGTMGSAGGKQKAVGLRDRAVWVEIAEQWKVNARLRLERLERKRPIDAHAKHQGVVVKECLVLLDRAHLVGADAGEGGGEEVEHDVLAAGVAQLEFLPVLVHEFEVGRGVAYFQSLGLVSHFVHSSFNLCRDGVG